MKYKLIKKLNGMSEGLEFKYYNGGSFEITSEGDISFDEMMSLSRYIDLVGIDDEDSFEKIEEDVLVPECINISQIEDERLAITRGNQGLSYDGEEYIVFNKYTEVFYVEELKCKLVKTTMSELKPGDLFFVGNLIHSDKLSHYNVYLGDNKWVHWYDGVREVENTIEVRGIHKVVKV